jgi:rhodanese-related sulfurtransferase
VEWEIARIQGAVHVPLRQVPDRTDQLDRSADIVVYCHHGQRSAAAAGFLRQAGFPRVRNLVGGIDAWSRDVDPGIPRY